MRYGKTIVYVADVQASLDFWERAFGFAVRRTAGWTDDLT